MKVIHCADLHLDSKMDSNLNFSQARQRNLELCNTFHRMVRFASENMVRVIMICGDLFDSSRVKKSTVDYIMDIITTHNDIMFLYLKGNHDEMFDLKQIPFPKNLKLFSDKWQYYRSGKIVFCGIELTGLNATTLYTSLKLSSENLNIVMMHGQVSNRCGPEFVNLSLLSDKSIDYLALGHIHSYEEKPIDHRGTYCYSGCLEGRGFDETGNKGFVLLDIGEHSVRKQFIPFAERCYHKIKIDISERTSVTQILSLIRQQISKIPASDLIMVTLFGNNAACTPIDVDFLNHILSGDYFYITVVDATTLPMLSSDQRDGISLKNEFMKSVYQDKTLSPDESKKVIQLGLHAMLQEEEML